MSQPQVRDNAPLPAERNAAAQVLAMLYRDKFALIAAFVLLLIILCALAGPDLVGDIAAKQNLRGRNAPPFSFSQGWSFILGADALGRPILPASSLQRVTPYSLPALRLLSRCSSAPALA
jgi:peptide/nickel transport system permease protein